MKASIAVANHKGGVGKTVTAVNLAGRLAKRGTRTLLVDVDAQAHASLWFADEVAHDLQDVLIEGLPIRTAIVPTRIEGWTCCRRPCRWPGSSSSSSVWLGGRIGSAKRCWESRATTTTSCST